LKYEGDVALARSHAIDPSGANENFAVAKLFETSDQTQQGRFAATRRTEQDAKFAVGNVERYILQDLRGAEAL
jgi:hypothetical protein